MCSQASVWPRRNQRTKKNESGEVAMKCLEYAGRANKEFSRHEWFPIDAFGVARRQMDRWDK